MTTSRNITAAEIPATYDDAIDMLVERDVARWGESERAASRALRRSTCPTIGLAVNALVHYDSAERIDRAAVAAAAKLLTAADMRTLRRGG